MFRILTRTLGLVSAALVALPLLAGTPTAYAEGTIAEGESQFRRCAACHQVGSGAQHGVGPHLSGLFGRQVASVEGYRFSEGLQARQGDVWNGDLLRTYIADPGGFVGGRSPMPAQRLRPDQVDDLIAYLASQSF